MSKRKNPSDDNNLNSDFCDFLMELAEYEKNVSRNVHKYNAYRKAASVLATHSKRIESGDEAKKLSGIGDKISKKIDEFLQTGKLRKLENIHQDEDAQAINTLTRVTGVGPVKAAEFVRNGIKSIEDLRNNIDKLTHHQTIGVRYFEDFEKKIPRKEIQDIEGKLKNLIKNLDPEFTVTICGSYRRGKRESGDIDALVTHPSLKINEKKKKHEAKLMKSLVDALKGLVTDVISIGDTKFMYYCAILYFTGSDVFNKTMRAHALDKGFTLNEYALRPVGVTGVPGEPVQISSEEDVFDYIDYPYKTPEERNM
ncbi:DNA polymerase beta [Operophtera brumata]|uniref:DNA polymerase n=1 Tax=Operophtera brumata TaxID=104452 RepID=A0A0L7LGK5_OPEBR|nr:DNA polymerase beta [Operophtera brumata]